MLMFAALPLLLQLTIVCLVGMCLGALVNWATYRLAWFSQLEISPWGTTPAKVPPRRFFDRLPVLGWWGLRREHVVHGRGFWIRPLLIELSMGVGLAALYWWEVQQEQLIIPQLRAWLQLPLLPLADVAPESWTQATFLNHLLLITLMAAASFIDIDEKIIPDTITVPGTLLGLLLAILLPIGLLPHVHLRATPEVISVPAELPELIQNAIQNNNVGTLYVEPVTLATPNSWPALAADWQFLVLGLGCWWLWCFAMTPKIFRDRHGIWRGFCIMMRRFAREWVRLPYAVITILGSLVVAGVWWSGGAAWVGLLSSLLGLAISGGLVWGVRIAGSLALKREAMGFGDVTLMMMVGTFLGWQASILTFFIAPMAGVIIALINFILHREKEIPYGPFLCLGALGVIVFWGPLWNRCQFAFEIVWLMPTVLVLCIVLLGVLLAIWQQIKMRVFKIE